MASYAIGMGLLATSRFAPAILDLGLWGCERVARGLYWVAWGRHVAASEETRLRQIIREELRSEPTAPSETQQDVVDHRRRKSW